MICAAVQLLLAKQSLPPWHSANDPEPTSLACPVQMWDLLVWGGAHPQSPISVTSKPRYFSELDLPASIHNLLEHCPEFWSSEEFEQPLQDIAALAPDWVTQACPAHLFFDHLLSHFRSAACHMS